VKPWKAAAGELTLIVETADRVYFRTVPAATPLDPTQRRGKAAEEATHDAASAGGLPDFVFPATTQRISSGNRELGDALIVIGDQGVVVQVKSRDAEGPTEEQRERNWVDKQVAKALRQASGTVRLLRSRTFDLTNGRGRTMTVDGAQLNWTALVVIDHDDPPAGVTPPAQAGPLPAVVLLRRDWEFLFDQLQSTHAVVRYLARCAGQPAELGDEVARYYDLAGDDADASPSESDFKFMGPEAVTMSTPLLPRRPAGLEDRRGQGVFRLILEDLALTAMNQPAEVLDFIAAVDTMPVAQRAGLGRLLLEQLKASRHTAVGDVRWNLRRVLSPGLHLAFGVSSTTSDSVRGAFSTWIQLRHYELGHSAPGRFGTSVGVLLSRRTDGARPWDTSMVAIQGDIDIDPETLRIWRRIWPTPGTPDLGHDQPDHEEAEQLRQDK